MHRNSAIHRTPRGGNAAFSAMGAPMVLPATTFSVSPNTPTVSNPADAQIVQTAREQITPVPDSVKAPTLDEGKTPWGSLLLACAVGAAITYFALKRP